MKRVLFLLAFVLIISGCTGNNKPLTEVVEIKYQPGQENRLEKAISEGRVDEVISLIKKISPDENINAKEKPIHLAVEKGNLEIIRVLTDARVDLNAINYNLETPLHIASRKGNPEIVKFLIERGAAVKQIDKTGLTPLHHAVLNSHLAIVKILVEKGANPKTTVYPYKRKDKSEFYGESALSIAIKRSDIGVVEFILKGLDLNRQINRKYPLEIAIDAGRPEIAELLLKNGADPNINRYNPLIFYAVKNDQKEIFRILIEHGAQIWDRSSYRPRNVFHSIINQRMNGFLELIPKDKIETKDREDLFNKSVDAGFLEGVKFFYYPGCINSENNSSNTLYRAVNTKSYDLTEFLLSKGTNPDTVIYGQSLLFRSLMNRDYKIAELLLDTGKTDPNHRDRNKWTPLHVAVSGDNINIVKKLIDKGADVNAKNYYNISPLITSFSSKNSEIFSYLIERGADFRGKFGQDLTALFFAGRSGNLKALKYLEEKGLSLEVKDQDGSYPYFYSNDKIIHGYYFSKGFDPNYINNKGRTALYYATYNRNLDLIKYLVEMGADYRKFKGVFNNPVYVAKQRGKNSEIDNFYTDLEVKRITFEIENIKPQKKTEGERFVKKDGYILDRKTNLMWADKDNGQNISFDGALKYCRNYKAGGFDDFRSPTIKELKTLYDVGALNSYGYHVAGDIGISDYSVWSSKERNEKGARFSFNKGKTTWYGKEKTVFGRALPVRGKLSEGDYKEVKSRIEKRDKDGRTYMHHAVFLRSKNLIKNLLEKGADIDAIDIDGKTPLNYAILAKDKEITSFLIENRALLEKRNREYLTPFLLACTDKKPDRNIINLLIEKGASVHGKTRKGNTAIHELVENADSSSWRRKDTKEIISVLISNGADYKIKNNDNKTPLEIAEHKGFSDIALIFYKAGVEKSGTPLHLAVLEKNRYKVRTLLEKNPEDINKTDNLGRTPLHWACINNDNSTALMLIRKEAKPDLKDKNGKTPLYYSVTNNDYYTSRALIERGAHAKELFEGDTLLHLAVNTERYVSTNLVELLIKKGVNVNAKDHFGKAAMHYISKKSNRYVAEVLLKSGADIEIKDKMGWTPLFHASVFGNSGMIKFLIKKGANKKAKDWQNKTPYQRANRKRIGYSAYNSLK